MKLPSTILISINTHGGIDSTIDTLSGERTLPIITIPYKLDTVIKIDSVPLGFSNYIQECETEKFINIIKNNLKNNICIEKCCDDIETLVNISNKIIFECKKMYKEKIKKNPKNIFYKNIQHDKTYKIKYFNSMDKIINKVFCYANDEKNEYIKNISILNKGYENIDLFELLHKNKLCKNYKDGLEITLEKILNFFAENNVKKVIIYDFSCFRILPEEIFTQRYLRRLRRDEIKLNSPLSSILNKKRTYNQI
jgi:hypothetical protein